MKDLFTSVSLLIGLLALIKSVIDRRNLQRIPILVFIEERFPHAKGDEVVIGLAAGTFMILGPLGIALGLGWAIVEPTNIFGLTFLLPGLLTVLVKLFWAGIEELIYRGAIMPQVAKFTTGLLALIISCLVFAWGHLERSGANTPDFLSLLVFALDGLGFGIGFLATRSLWLSTIWHAAKNLWIWVLFGTSTLQLTPGLFEVHFNGPVLWVGASGQAGLLDLIASLSLGVVLLIIYRKPIISGLAWVKNQ